MVDSLDQVEVPVELVAEHVASSSVSQLTAGSS